MFVYVTVKVSLSGIFCMFMAEFIKGFTCERISGFMGKRVRKVLCQCVCKYE